MTQEQTLLDVYENGPRLPDDIVEHRVVYKYRIYCQWKHQTRDRACVACWGVDSDRPISNAECYQHASEAGFILKDGHVECGNHREDDDD